MNSKDPVVFIVDDDESVRDGIGRLLGSIGLAVETFPTAEAFLDARRDDIPGCLVLDVRLPELGGLELQQRLLEAEVPRPIVFITGHGDIPMSVRAMKAGAIEFLTKPFRAEELIRAIREALAQDRVAREEAERLAELRRRYESLSAREREVMAGVVAGRLNKQIAADFGTRETTVKEQRAQVMQKMQASSVAELVRFAAQLSDDARRSPASRRG
ncbi:response regulator transcription factor [Polyangium jinanense]|uniref:response regulator transcription factor n=1 Tax=Polyangium jinanense TaxID=2829994 RepID=UPI002341B648|nr:response regulator [Polyangium jinanense]MDC3958044.1 response regulator transcription factor [Polyangium jinanense]